MRSQIHIRALKITEPVYTILLYVVDIFETFSFYYPLVIQYMPV